MKIRKNENHGHRVRDNDLKNVKKFEKLVLCA